MSVCTLDPIFLLNRIIRVRLPNYLSKLNRLTFNRARDSSHKALTPCQYHSLNMIYTYPYIFPNEIHIIFFFIEVFSIYLRIFFTLVNTMKIFFFILQFFCSLSQRYFNSLLKPRQEMYYGDLKHPLHKKKAATIIMNNPMKVIYDCASINQIY